MFSPRFGPVLQPGSRIVLNGPNSSYVLLTFRPVGIDNE